MTELLPRRQKQVVFYGDSIVAVQLDDGQVYVPIRQMCDLLGISYQGQIDRIRRDPVLKKYEQPLPLERAEEQGGSGGEQITNCLALKYVPGWLFGISSSRVRADVRDKLIVYQEQVHDVIWQAFRDEIEASAPAQGTAVGRKDEFEAIEQMGLAIYRLARQQRALDARLDNVEDAIWEVDERVRGEMESLRGQLHALELRLVSPPRQAKISDQQAADLSQAVKVVATALGKKSGRNEFGAIYGELYRRFGITTYRNLPVHAFRDAMDWLEEWFRSLQSSEEESTS